MCLPLAVHLDVKVEVPQLGTVTVDVSWGGIFYVIADAANSPALTPDEGAISLVSAKCSRPQRRNSILLRILNNLRSQA